MSYFDDPVKVDEYIKLAEGFDGKDQVEVLCKYLAKGSSVLELGMGPGKDLDLLLAHYQATGSDASKTFVELYEKSHPGADLLLLDAVTLETDRKWQGVYSNKVLHHLKEEELVQSLDRQGKILEPGAVLVHSFWRGEGTDMIQDLRFTYYTEQGLTELFGINFRVLECLVYQEMEKDDSILLVAEVCTP